MSVIGHEETSVVVRLWSFVLRPMTKDEGPTTSGLRPLWLNNSHCTFLTFCQCLYHGRPGFGDIIVVITTTAHGEQLTATMLLCYLT